MKVINIQEEGRFAGPHKRMMEVAAELKKKDVETVLLFSSIQSEIFVDKLKNTDISFKTLRLHKLTKDIFHFIGYFFWFFPELFAVYRFLKREKPDLVHCNGSWQWKGLVAAKMAGIPVVWHLSDTYMPKVIQGPFWFFKKFFVNHFIGACERAVAFYLNDKKNFKTVHVIQAPVITEEFKPSKVISASDLGKIPGKLVLTIGNITPVKGHERLLKVAEKMKEQQGDLIISFVIIGRVWDSQKKYYQKLLSYVKEKELSNVYFLGGTNEVKEHLKGADLFFCSSEFEASPIAVWEALSMSLPVVSTDVGDVKQIVQGNGAGFVMEGRDIDGFVSRILKLVKDRELRNEMSINARKVALNYLDISICAKNHLECYQDILNS